MSLPVTPQPKVWFDASDATTLTSDTQGTVSEWRSKVGSITATPNGSASRSLNMASNGGLTIAFRARLTNPGLNERIIEFANAGADQNVFIYRTGVSNSFSIIIFNASSAVISGISSTAGSLDSQFHNWIFRINGNTRTVQIYRDGGSPNATGTYTTDIIDRTVSKVYVGRSVWTDVDDTTEGDISALYVFDRYITDDEMATINTHMSSYTATPLPIYNAKVSLNAALLTQAANTAVAAWEDYAQVTASYRPTFQLNPPRVNFIRGTGDIGQHLIASTPVVKTSRLTQNGRNSLLFPPESALRTTTLQLTGSTSVRNIFAVARNLTEVNGGAIATWSNVRFLRLERTTSVVQNFIYINEIEVYDAQGRRIPHNSLSATMSTPYESNFTDHGPQLVINNTISTTSVGYPHTQDSPGAFIQVDLGQERTISKVIIRNRYDCCQDRLKGTTLRLQRADNATNVASIPITNINPQSLIFTPNGLFFGAGINQSLNLFTTSDAVTGAVIARYSGYRSLQLIPFAGASYNLDTAMMNDTEVNVFSLINDPLLANSVRVNGYPQAMVTTASNSYTNTTSRYIMNYNAGTEASSALQLCELIVYDNALTVPQIQQIEKYLYDRWYVPASATGNGVSTNIPVPRVWLDAADADTIQANTQNTLTNWTSKGNAYGIVGSPGAGIGAQRTFNIGSNGGFTAAFRARHTGTAGSYERIFDFGSGTEIYNIIVGRFGTTNDMAFWIMTDGGRIVNQYQLSSAIDGNFHNYIIRVDANTRTAKWYKDSATTESSSYTFTAGLFLTDRTLTNCYIGQSNYAGEAYLNGDISALYMFDRCLTNEEMVVVYNHMLNNTATPLPIYNPIVSLNAALINSTAGTALTAWEDFTASGGPTYQTSPEKTVRFARASTQFFTEGNPIIKTGRLQQYGKNTILFPPQSALQTTATLTGSTTSRSVFAVARNLTEMTGGTVTPWANVRYVRLQRTTGTDPLNINEIEVYDGTGKRIPVNTLTATQSSQNGTVADYGPQLAIDNTIATGISGYAHTLSGASEFIQVDMGSEKSVSKVIIRNRYDAFKTRLSGTTLFLRRADGATNVATQVIAMGLDSTIITPGGICGVKFAQNNLFANTAVTGAVNADISDYKTLSLNPQGSGNNVDTTLMVDDSQPNVFAIVNDATVGNTARVNATTQTLRTTATNAYSMSSATHITNYNAAAEANSALQLCELMIYDVSLTAQQVTDIQTYLIQKWQFTIGSAVPDILRPDGCIPNQLTYWWTLTNTTKISSITLSLTGLGAGTGTASVNALTTISPQYTFSGLSTSSIYNATIWAVGEEGQTSAPQSYRAAIPSSVPSIPRDVTFSQPSSSTLRVTWTEPEFVGGSPIEWYMVQSEDESLRYGTEGYRRAWTITGIPPGTRKFKIQAINSAGYGVAKLSDTTFTFS